MAYNRKEDQLEILWRKMRENSSAAAAEARAQKGHKSKHYENLVKDGLKLKDEYEKLKGGGTHDPLSYESGDRLSARKVLGDFTGKTGETSHNRLED